MDVTLSEEQFQAFLDAFYDIQVLQAHEIYGTYIITGAVIGAILAVMVFLFMNRRS